MLEGLIILAYLILSVAIFWINQIWLLILLSVVEVLVLWFQAGFSCRKLRPIVATLPFIGFIFLCNLVFTDLQTASLVALRLLDVINLTLVLRFAIGVTHIGYGLAWLLTPLKLLRVDVERLTLVIILTINLIPLLRHDAKTCQLALQTKGFNFDFYHLLRYPQVVLLAYFRLLLRRVEELEQALLSKGFES